MSRYKPIIYDGYVFIHDKIREKDGEYKKNIKYLKYVYDYEALKGYPNLVLLSESRDKLYWSMIEETHKDRKQCNGMLHNIAFLHWRKRYLKLASSLEYVETYEIKPEYTKGAEWCFTIPTYVADVHEYMAIKNMRLNMKCEAMTCMCVIAGGYLLEHMEITSYNYLRKIYEIHDDTQLPSYFNRKKEFLPIVRYHQIQIYYTVDSQYEDDASLYVDLYKMNSTIYDQAKQMSRAGGRATLYKTNYLRNIKQIERTLCFNNPTSTFKINARYLGELRKVCYIRIKINKNVLTRIDLVGITFRMSIYEFDKIDDWCEIPLMPMYQLKFENMQRYGVPMCCLKQIVLYCEKLVLQQTILINMIDIRGHGVGGGMIIP